MHLALLVPVYNEERALEHSVRRALRSPLPPGVTRRTLVLIDDGSADSTPRILATLKAEPDSGPHLHPIRHQANRGKGAAVRTALAAAIEIGADLLLVHDADLEYDPADHPRVLAPLIDGRADAVIGSRFLGDTHRVLYFWHSVANKVITTLSNVFTNLNLTDIECCSKAFTRQVALQLTLEEDRFGIEPELVAKLARVRLAAPLTPGAPATPGSQPPSAARLPRIYEVAVSYAGRTYAEGKKITWKDGLAALGCILKYNLMQ
ncbi:MAG: glycosyltransferase family 2 protein [Phycisphaerales bacterium]|nr:glycosyltransferase family 2 protein [Phycisphaerales bacterium]